MMTTHKRCKRKRRKKTETGNNKITKGKRMFEHKLRRIRRKHYKTTMTRGNKNKQSRKGKMNGTHKGGRITNTGREEK